MYNNNGSDAAIASELGNGVQPTEDKTFKLIDALLGKRDELLRSIRSMDEQIADIHKEMGRKLEEAKSKQRPLEEALAHLEALLRIEGWTPTGDSLAASSPYVIDGKAPVHAAYQFLAELEKPMHYRELTQKLLEKGVYLTGKDPAATLLSQMSRDTRFKRSPDRGVYGLAQWKMRSSKKKGRAKRQASIR